MFFEFKLLDSLLRRKIRIVNRTIEVGEHLVLESLFGSQVVDQLLFKRLNLALFVHFFKLLAVDLEAKLVKRFDVRLMALFEA